MTLDELDAQTSHLAWRTLRPIKYSRPRWRAFVDSRLERLRQRSPGLVEDSWWLAKVKPSPVSSLSLDKLEILKNPPGSFLADPLALEGAEDEYLVEQYIFSERKGVISHLRFDEFGRALVLERVIDEPFHLSFPMSFVWNDRTWVVCEAASSGETHLWEYERNSGMSHRRHRIFDFPLRDTSIFGDGDRWYLLGTVADPSWKLVMYSSDNPLSGWISVPLENRTSVMRLAGTPIAEPASVGTDGHSDREWTVPLQGHSRGYGTEVEVCRLRLAGGVAVLDTDFRIDPPTPYIGLHTIAPGRSQVVVDIKYLKIRRDRLAHRFRPRRLMNRLTGRSRTPS